MPKKEAIAEKVTRAVKKAAVPRVKAAKHRTVAAPAGVIVEAVAEIVDSPSRENIHAVIAVAAYGYWEARGRQGGDPLEDWVRAEKEIRRAL